jgi:glutamate decarboxylase
VLRALVKHTLSRAQIDRLANDIEHACETLEKKGTAHKSERHKIKRTPNY